MSINYRLPRIYIPTDSSKQWVVNYYYKSPEDGKMVRFREYVSNRIHTKSGKMKAATELRKRITEKLQSGWNPFKKEEKEYTNIIEAIHFAVEIKCNITYRKRTISAYHSVEKTFVEFLNKYDLGSKYVENFTTNDAQKYMDWLKINKKWKNISCNNHRAFMKALFHELIERDYIYLDPFRKVKKMKNEESEVIAYSQNELQRINILLPEFNFQLYCIAINIFHAYIRPQELCRLKIGDIDLLNQKINIFPRTSKTKQFRVITIHPELLEVYEQMELNRHRSTDYLFSTHLKPGKNMISPTRIHEQWKKFREYSGIQNSIYKLKHTGAGMSSDAGANMRDLQLQLGHSSLAITQIYLDKYRKSVPVDNLKSFASFSKKT